MELKHNKKKERNDFLVKISHFLTLMFLLTTFFDNYNAKNKTIIIYKLGFFYFMLV